MDVKSELYGSKVCDSRGTATTQKKDEEHVAHEAATCVGNDKW